MNKNLNNDFFRHFVVNLTMFDNYKKIIYCYDSSEFLEKLYYRLCVYDNLSTIDFLTYVLKLFQDTKILLRCKYEYKVEIFYKNKKATRVKNLDEWKTLYVEIISFLETCD